MRYVTERLIPDGNGGYRWVREYLNTTSDPDSPAHHSFVANDMVWIPPKEEEACE